LQHTAKRIVRGIDEGTSATSAVSATVGVVCLAAGPQGWLLRECSLWQRIALLAAALLLIKPGYVTDAIGLGLLVLVIVVQRMLRAPAPGAGGDESVLNTTVTGGLGDTSTQTVTVNRSTLRFTFRWEMASKERPPPILTGEGSCVVEK
jgi:hypothetical protein